LTIVEAATSVGVFRLETERKILASQNN